MDENSKLKKSSILQQQPDKEVNFTGLESQCVLQFMQNQPPAKIGLDLGLSQNSVRFYLMNAGQKLRLIGGNKSGNN
jgi:DNA-binding CsgD family transcriptional regulator